MLARLLKTDRDRAALVARVGLGLVMFPHGAQKLFGWFGGYGVSGTIGFFNQQLHIPALFGYLAIAAEALGSLGLVLGLLSRVAAFGILCNMLAAVLLVHLHNGFFMNWTGKAAGEGFEYHILAITLALIVLIRGGGAASLDGLLSREK
ncbi:MAG TPA: DoxX family protein [Gemmatimonadales bacterium]|nr:DoxX family protein [Gemmatimonadales bacterium]